MLLIDLAWKTTGCWSSGNQELLAQCVVLTAGQGEGAKGAPLRAEHSSFCIDRWMLPLAIHLGLVKHSETNWGASALDLEPASNVFQSCLFLSSSPFPALCFHLSMLLHICPIEGYVVLQFKTRHVTFFFHFSVQLTHHKGDRALKIAF